MNLNVFEIARKGMAEVKQKTTCKLPNSRFKKKNVKKNMNTLKFGVLKLFNLNLIITMNVV
jgi:hypothetical protein